MASMHMASGCHPSFHMVNCKPALAGTSAGQAVQLQLQLDLNNYLQLGTLH